MTYQTYSEVVAREYRSPPVPSQMMSSANTFEVNRKSPTTRKVPVLTIPSSLFVFSGIFEVLCVTYRRFLSSL